MQYFDLFHLNLLIRGMRLNKIKIKNHIRYNKKMKANIDLNIFHDISKTYYYK